MVKELSAEQVRKKCDPSLFKCSSTEDLKPQESIIGQDRALSALKFGLNIMKPGFNIYVSGPAGTGRTTATKSFLEAQVEAERYTLNSSSDDATSPVFLFSSNNPHRVPSNHHNTNFGNHNNSPIS